MTAQCIGQPISWLRLEQLALGELAGGDRTRVQEHVDACEVCRACLDGLRVSERELPALPELPPAPLPWWKLHGRLVLGGGFATVAVAVAIAVVVLRGGGGPADDALIPSARTHVKGGEAAIELVRERDGSTALDPGLFDRADRFKVMFTCPPGAMFVDVFVRQDGELSFPLASQTIECTNRAALSGAFHITGAGRAAVCVAFDRDRAPDRGTARRLQTGVVCAGVAPANP